MTSAAQLNWWSCYTVARCG